MQIQPTAARTETITKTEAGLKILWWKFYEDNKNPYIEFFWRILNTDGSVKKQGIDKFKGQSFIDWYNNDYKLHPDLWIQFARILKYEGSIIDDGILK